MAFRAAALILLDSEDTGEGNPHISTDVELSQPKTPGQPTLEINE